MRKHVRLAAFMIVYIVLLSLLSVYDFSFTQLMSQQPLKVFSEVGRRIGPAPLFLVPAYCLNCLLGFKDKGKGASLLVLFCCAGAAYCVALPNFNEIFDLLILAVFWSLFFFLVRSMPLPEDTRQHRLILKLCIGTVLAGFTVLQICKFTWGRPRYLAIIQEGAIFQSWHQIAGFAVRDDLYRSFPSGHTYCAAVSFCMIFLPDLYPDFPVSRKRFGLYAGIFTVLIALSRIAAGKHYISDVMGGAGIFLVLFSIAIVWKWEELYGENS